MIISRKGGNIKYACSHSRPNKGIWSPSSSYAVLLLRSTWYLHSPYIVRGISLYKMYSDHQNVLSFSLSLFPSWYLTIYTNFSCELEQVEQDPHSPEVISGSLRVSGKKRAAGTTPFTRCRGPHPVTLRDSTTKSTSVGMDAPQSIVKTSFLTSLICHAAVRVAHHTCHDPISCPFTQHSARKSSLPHFSFGVHRFRL